MEQIVLPVPRKKRVQMPVFISPDSHKRIIQLAEERGEPPGRVASLILEAALDQLPFEA